MHALDHDDDDDQRPSLHKILLANAFSEEI